MATVQRTKFKNILMRNKNLTIRVIKGETYKMVSERYEISKARVGQIVLATLTQAGARVVYRDYTPTELKEAILKIEGLEE